MMSDDGHSCDILPSIVAPIYYIWYYHVMCDGRGETDTPPSYSCRAQPHSIAELCYSMLTEHDKNEQQSKCY